MPSSADRELLFGLLALQNDFLTRDQLLAGVNAWLRCRGESLGEVLQRRGLLAAEDAALVAALVGRHLARHGGDGPRSLAAVRAAAEVRDELARLGDGEVERGLATLPLLGGAAAAPAPAARYRKVRPHARGGLGEVFVAVDEELRREVALKEIQPQHADRPEHRARFVREAEITGNLEHPGIVPVHGLGAQADGRPCYAMRFVRGESLHEAIARFHRQDEGRRDPGERELALRGLLARFVAVCQAVAYAHSRGVVHRDIKPANVMLGEYGETYVVDWGLAKSVGQPEGATAAARPVPAGPSNGAAPTEAGQVVGTPAFMPPEQARGELERVDHRSDVFALGATLYCLLTGRPPYERDGVSLLAAAAECDHPPARQVNAKVPRALEAVCARAMAARPEGRYASARQLAADVERWLADEPVTAMAEPVREKLRRWARRNRTLVASAVALLLAGVVGLAVGLGAVRAEERRTAAERDRAEGAEREARANLEQSEANFRLARRVVDDCFGIAKDHPLLQGPLLSPELHKLKRLLLEKALPFYRRFRAARPADRAVQADLLGQHLRVGYIQEELGSKPEALASYRAAEQVARALLKAQPGVPEYQDGLAAALTNLGNLLQAQGQEGEARRGQAEAVSLYRALVQAHPGVPEHRSDLAAALLNMGSAQRALGRPGEARRGQAEAVALYRALVQAHPGVPQYQDGLARALGNLGAVLEDLGQRGEARKSHEEAVARHRALVRAQPGAPQHQDGLAAALTNLGNLLQAQGQEGEAHACCIEAVALYRALVKARAGVPEHRSDLARALNNLGVLQGALGRPADARSSHAEAVALYRALVRAHPDSPQHQDGLARALDIMGVVQRALGQPADARSSHAEAVALYRALVRVNPGVPQHQDGLARALGNRGNAQRALGQPAEARSSYAEAAALYRALVQAHPGVPGYRLDLCRPLIVQALLLRSQRRPEEARRHLDEAVTGLAWLNQNGAGGPQVDRLRLLAHQLRAAALAEAGRHRPALADWERALALAPAGERLAVRLRRAAALARAGEHGLAAEEAEALARQGGPTPATAYRSACVLALSAAGASRDAGLPLPLREHAAEGRAGRAVALLQALARAGYFGDPARRARLDRDRDLDFLRGRADFRAFAAGLAKRAE